MVFTILVSGIPFLTCHYPWFCISFTPYFSAESLKYIPYPTTFLLYIIGHLNDCDRHVVGLSASTHAFLCSVLHMTTRASPWRYKAERISLAIFQWFPISFKENTRILSTAYKILRTLARDYHLGFISHSWATLQWPWPLSSSNILAPFCLGHFALGASLAGMLSSLPISHSLNSCIVFISASVSSHQSCLSWLLYLEQPLSSLFSPTSLHLECMVLFAFIYCLFVSTRSYIL